MNKTPGVNVDILIKKDNKILLGLLSPKWSDKNKLSFGVPGRDIKFAESIGQAVKRNIMEELGCKLVKYEIISVNANYALGNHYIGIGILASIKGRVKLLKPDDWQSWQWVDIKKLPDNIFPPAKNLIDCYLQNKFNITE
jgi:ADP-ribose pyrophosphatase YjhB (NUDIX family)